MRLVDHLPFGVVADNRSAPQPLQDAHLDFLGTQLHKPIESGSETFQRFSRQAHDQIRMNVNACFIAEKSKVVVETSVILMAADVLCCGGIKGLNTDFKLQCARRKLRDDLPQGLRQPVRNHLEMHKQSRPKMIQKELENRPARRRIQIEGAIHELELLRPAVEQILQLLEQHWKGKLTNRHVERRQAKLTKEGA